MSASPRASQFVDVYRCRAVCYAWAEQLVKKCQLAHVTRRIGAGLSIGIGIAADVSSVEIADLGMG